MASGKDYLALVLEQLSVLEGITWRAMMGEYILYYRGRIFGGIYDDRLLVKPVDAALRLMPGVQRERPYDSGSEMLLVEQLDDKAFLCELVTAMYEQLPEPRKKRK